MPILFYITIGNSGTILAPKRQLSAKNLFQLLCMSDSGTRLESLYDLAKHIPVPIEPEVFVKIWTFTHGIATIVSTNTTNIAPEEIRQLLTEACASFKLYYNENKESSGNETQE